VDVGFLVALFRQGLLPEARRLQFVEKVEEALLESADSSFLTDEALCSVVTAEEKERLLKLGANEVLGKLEHHADRVRREWNHDYSPVSHFEPFSESVNRLTALCAPWIDTDEVRFKAKQLIERTTDDMFDLYEPPEENEKTAVQQSENASTPLDDLFRDLDE